MSILGELFESFTRQVAPRIAEQIYGVADFGVTPTSGRQRGVQRIQELEQLQDVGIHQVRPVITIQSPTTDIAVVK